MASRNRKSASGQGFQVEPLEGRALLSAAAVAHPASVSVAQIASIHAAATQPKAVTFQGKASGSVSELTPSATSPWNTKFTAYGSLFNIPKAVAVGGIQVSGMAGATLTASNGVATFFFPLSSPGTYIKVFYSGSGTAVHNAQTQTINITGKIVDGGGTFRGVTGTLTGTVTVPNTVTTGPSVGFVLNYTLSVTPAH